MPFNKDQQHDQVKIAPNNEYHSIDKVLSGAIEPGLKYVWEYAKLSAAVYNRDSKSYINHNWLPCSTQFKISEGVGRKQPNGMKLQAWHKKSSDEKTIFIALVFRGTRFNKFNDWIYGNFHWVTRLSPLSNTYYEQLIQNIDLYVKELKAEVNASADQQVCLISAGHSLGGGLAQCAAYAVDEIKLCYAFDSSPVTAYFAFSKEKRVSSSKGLHIFRIYEDREVLRYLRSLTQQTYKLAKRLTNINPRFIESRFNLIERKNIISNHSINNLANELEAVAVKYKLIDNVEPVIADDDIAPASTPAATKSLEG